MKPCRAAAFPARSIPLLSSGNGLRDAYSAPEVSIGQGLAQAILDARHAPEL
jgi:hypothetical protein